MADMNNSGRSFEGLIAKCREIIQCDTARISQPGCQMMFLIIGFYRHTADSPGQWYKNGAPHDFEYIEEKAVASGFAEEQLIESVKAYKRSCDMTMQDYIKEKLTHA